MMRYNQILGELDQGAYRPLYDHDCDDSILWETWIEGFWKETRLRPRSWLTLAESADDDVHQVMFSLIRLYELATMPAADLQPLDIDEDLEELAPDLIPDAIGTLHRARIARQAGTATATTRKQPKIGRNDPCPCGSGKKFKHCCLNQP